MQLLSFIRIFVWLLPLGCTLVLANAAVAATSAELRSELVRQTVLDILSYTRWPSEPARLRLCITAPTEYASSLLTIERQANGRPVEVHRYDMGDEALIQRCDVIYLGVLAPAQRLSLFERLRGHAILSISEQSRECIADAVFCLQAGEERGRFRVNLDALACSGVRVHPAVLKLARADEEVR
ncbi:YfiR family protein [Aeromonas caviae]|uniref:YfiR family protein n=1 Tax=Aeromonas caviae TaxID=648 RepID=UPI000FEBBC8B|nr:YfiR family protein [Aeromonas caviae]RWT27838.1 DUF4154 domain-containing protein [Aeromonas caviae]